MPQKPNFHTLPAGVHEKGHLSPFIQSAFSDNRTADIRPRGLYTWPFWKSRLCTLSMAGSCWSITNGATWWALLSCSCYLSPSPEDHLCSQCRSRAVMGLAQCWGDRPWAPPNVWRVLVRPQSSGEGKPAVDQKEVGPTGRRSGGEACLVSDDSSD